MSVFWSPREHAARLTYVLKWLAVAAPTGAVIGSLVALFLWSLDRVTQARWDHPQLLYFLPLAGIAIGAMYHWFGRSVEGGTDLIIEQIHEPGGGVPARMTPLVLIGTLVTHLFGGSAGREGTAVQMGGSVASVISRVLRLRESDVRTLLMAGVAAGFGAVFGTPLTGAIFALEVLAIGRMSFEAVIPCLIASIAADATTTAWGIHHTRYAPFVASAISLDAWLLGKVIVAAVAFGFASVLFVGLTRSLHAAFRKIIPSPLFRPALGGVIVIALVFLLGTRDYLGLGVVADPNHPGGVSIVSSFQPGVSPFAWFWKSLFTAVTLGSGFRGGEVTPLFFIGSTLGNALAWLMNAPIDLFAALGFVAVFAGATNTPLACTIMGVELFVAGNPHAPGPSFVVYLAVACFVSYLCSGHAGIYRAQRIGSTKFG